MNILVVEDESLIALEIQDYLNSFGYKNVYTATNSIKALKILQDKNIDLIFMDINLKSDISGIELVKNIQKNDESIDVIYITSYGEDQTINEAIKTKPLAYLTKPFKSSDIKAQVKIAENKNQLKLQNIVYLFNKEFSYNFITKELLRHNKKIKLQKRDIKILEFIIENKNKKFISYEEFDYCIWEDDFISASTRRVAIHSLNTKFDNRLLKTQHGLGISINTN